MPSTAAYHYFPHLLSQVIVTSFELGLLPIFIPSVVYVPDDVVHPPPIRGGQTCRLLDLGISELDRPGLGLSPNISERWS